MGCNMNSLNDYKTQVKFINKLKSAPENCFILCDTRLGSDSQRFFAKLGGEQSHFNSYSTSQRGLAILIKDSLPVKDVKVENIIKGNYTKLTFKVTDQNLLIKCIYAPNDNMTNSDVDNESNIFFKTVFDDKDEDKYDIRVTVGDFNVAPKHDIDTLGYLHVDNQNTRKFLNRMIPLSNLTDIW